MTFLLTDKLRVFVSSRLEECADERGIARSAVTSLAHEPIMFEAAGARSHPPRSIYLRGLDESQIFIGIYREGYGYVAEGMDISGVEDEYRYAKNLGIPQLLYVRRGVLMEARQKAFVDGFTGPNITVAHYNDSSSLGEQIRDDLAALVAEYFRRGQSVAAIAPPKPGSLAEELAPTSGRIRRSALENALVSLLESDAFVAVIGPIGAGKTVFLSVLADELDWAFVQCGDRSPLEIVSDVANSVRHMLGLPAKGFLQIREATTALQAAWQACTSITLVLDDVRTEEVIADVQSGITVDSKRRLIAASRGQSPLAAKPFLLPPLELQETKEFVAKNRSIPIVPGELEKLQQQSGGNPLYLRYYLGATPGQFEKTLSDYELKVWVALPPKTREALSYLALTTRPLTLEELAQLVSERSESVEALAEALSSARSLLIESTRGYAIFHPHAIQTVRDALKSSSARLSFYTKRLSKWFAARHDYSAAFNALSLAGLDAPRRLLELAGRHAATQGDVGTAIRILQLQIASSHAAGDSARERDLMLGLAQMQSHAGRTNEALETLEAARLITADRAPPIPIDEMHAGILAWTRGDLNAFAALKAVQAQHTLDGRDWDAARLAVDISGIHIRRKEYPEAATEAEFAIRVFEAHEDTYGLRIAKMNLLSAISAIPDRAVEANALLDALEVDSGHSPRQRAAICNVLGRAARERNDIAGAKSYAREAIEIGITLEDAGVVCVNLINVGNAFRQEKNWDAALAEYEAADKVARDAGLTIMEASAQELIASVFNSNGDGAKAVHHATYAISLVKNGISEREEASATEELAKALELTGDDPGAWAAWLNYAELEARCSKEQEAASYGFVRAVSLMQKHGAGRQYVESYRKLYTGPFANSKVFSRGECLVEDLAPLLDEIALPYVFDAAVYHSRLAFDGLPKPFVRRVYLQMIKRLFDKKVVDTRMLKRLRIALALSMAVPPQTLTTGDIVDVGEQLARLGLDISFRARPDGAAHWAMNVPLGRPVIVTISQIDDRPDVSLITLCLTLVLIAFAPDILEDVLVGAPPLRDEANIQVSNFDEAKILVPLENIGLTSLDGGCAVTRATNVKADAGAPIFVVTGNNLTREWLVGSGKGNSGQELFANVVVELVYHLQAGEIELESLYPKVITVIKRTIV